MVGVESTLGASIEIHIEAKGLANMDVFSLSDPFAFVEESLAGGWQEVGRTETIWDDLNPKWVRSFTLPPTTLLEAVLRVSVYDRDAKTQDLDKHEIIGVATCQVNDVLREGSNGKTCNLQNSTLKETGTVTLIGELYDEHKPCHEIILGKCKFKNASLFGMFMSKPYIAIYRRRANNEWAPVYRSKTFKKGETAAFSEDLLNKAQLRTAKHGGTCEETPLRIELRSHRSSHEHKLIGAVQMSLASLRRQTVGKKISLGLAGESVGELCITQITLAEHSSTFDFEISFGAK